MPRYCYRCGRLNDPTARFCVHCGADLEAAPFDKPDTPAQPTRQPAANRQPGSQAAPGRQPLPQSSGGYVNRTQEFIRSRQMQANAQHAPVQMPRTPVPPVYPAQDMPGPAKKKGAGKKIIAAVLIVAILAGVWYTGFKNPGFFVKEDEPWPTQEPTPQETQEVEDITDALSHTSKEDADWENIDYSELSNVEAAVSTDPADCELRFSENDVAAATAQTAAISRNNPTAEFGDVKVNLKSWNLDKAKDELSVRSLGTISEGDEGWSITGYDFSLASGQDTFATNVEITIPRTATDDEVGTCVTFNEETKQWEELYSTVNEDGKSYTIYTNHFSIKGEKKLKYVYSGGILKKNKSDETINIDSGIFHERFDPKKGTRMQSYVFADRKLLWAMYMAKDNDTISNLFKSVETLKELDINALQHQAADERDAACLFIGTAGGLDNLNTLFGSIGYNAPFLGTYLTAADVALNLLNVQATAMESDKPYLEALSDALYKHRDAVGNSIATAVLALSAAAVYGNWVGAVVGTVMWGATYVIDKAMEPAAWDVTDTPEWEDLYKVFYLTSGVKVTCGSKNANAAIADNKYTYAIMKKPKAFTKKQWEELSKVVNKKPLRVEEVYDEEAGAYRYDFLNFAPAFTKIIEMFYNDPFKMEEAIEGFYTSYANAMWNLPDKSLYNFAKYQCSLGAGTQYFKDEFTIAGDLSRPDKEDIKTWRDDMVSLCRARTAEQLEDAMETALQNTFSQVVQNTNRLESLLNTKLVFHVEDQTLLPGETFKDSIYCVDWQKIPENKEYLPKNNKDHSGGYDDPELVTPMRFVCEDPLFKPLEGVKDSDGGITNVNIPFTEYYPYVPDFLPRAKKGQRDDVVYTCTLYHYLMMGAPQQMLFKDCSDPKHYTDIEGILVDIEFPEIKEGMSVADVKIRVNTGNDIGVLEGMWGPAPNGTPYEKKEHGQVNLIVEEGGKHNTFLSELASQKACSYHEGGTLDDSKFVYTRNAKKEGEKQTGILTIWKPDGEPDDKLALTIEEVEANVIFLKEWNLYLMRYETTAGNYTLSIDKDQIGGNFNPPDCSLSIGADGTITLKIPAMKDQTYTKETKSSTTTDTASRSGFKIEAKKSTMMEDLPYGYDVAIGKVYTITSVTDKITYDSVSVYKSKDKETTSTSKKTFHSIRIARGVEEEVDCSYIVLYYDCKNPKKLLFVQVFLYGKSDYEHDYRGKKETEYKDSDSTYYMQLNVK